MTEYTTRVFRFLLKFGTKYQYDLRLLVSQSGGEI